MSQNSLYFNRKFLLTIVQNKPTSHIIPDNTSLLKWIIGLSFIGAFTSFASFMSLKFVSLQVLGVIANTKAIISFILGMIYLNEAPKFAKVI